MPARNSLQSRVEIPLLVRSLRLPGGGSLLEVGCGRGVAIPEFARRLKPDRIVGLDSDQQLLDVATEYLTRAGIEATLINADVRTIPMDDVSIDIVIDFGTCYHIDEPEKALSEIRRVLKPGGLFVHETRASQLLAHPLRSFGRSIPWEVIPDVVPERRAGLWTARRKS
jgi:ubiquinone/menaquinone biosynthesis C-methylase UbiE